MEHIKDPEVVKCIEAFKNGKPCMVFDSAFRECETDLLWPASAATPKVMRTLRNDCGGLLFLAIGHEVGELFGLPFLQDIYMKDDNIKAYPVLDELKTNDLQYDTKSAFTLSLNHRDTFTGITDKDRALTTQRFAKLYDEELKRESSPKEARAALGKEFRTPGHIPLCRETQGGLKKRQGHTELAVAIARLAECEPCTIGAEMLEPNGDRALTVDDAKKYAKKNKIPMVTGAQIMEALQLGKMEAEGSATKKQKR